MAEHDGHVRIKLSLDSKGVASETRGVKDTFKRLGQQAKQAISDVSFAGVEKNAKAASSAVSGVSREIAGMSAAQAKVAASYAKKTAEIAKLTEHMRQGETKANEATQQLQNKQDTLKDSLARTTAEADKLQRKWDELNAKVKRSADGDILPGQEKRIAELDKLGNQMANLDDKARSYQRRIDELQSKIERLNAVKVGETGGTQSGLKSKLEAAQVEAEALKRKLDEIDQAEKNVGRRSGIASNVGGALKKGLNDAGTTAKRVFAGIVDYSRNATKRIQDHFKPLTKTLHRFGVLFKQAFVFGVVMQTLTKIREALGQIAAKDAVISKQLRTIKGNLLAAFAPLWQAVYPAVVAILNVITAITSAFANLSVEIFGELGEGAKNTAKMLNGEAKAIKGVSDAAKSATKELGAFDEINQISTTGGGGGGAAGALKSSAGVLTDLSWTFEDIYERLMAINWEQVAARINSALLSIDFAYIASRLRGGAQYILGALNDLLVGIDWVTLGSNIATGLNELLTGDFLPDLARTLANWFNAKIRLFYGLVTTFDWAGFGTALANSINTFFAVMDWNSLGDGFSTFAWGVLSAIEAALNAINWENIGQTIRDLVAGINWNKWIAKITRVIWEAMQSLGTLVISLTSVSIADGGISSTATHSSLMTALSGIFATAGLAFGGLAGGAMAIAAIAGIKMIINGFTAEEGSSWDSTKSVANGLLLLLMRVFAAIGGVSLKGTVFVFTIGAILGISIADIVWGDVTQESQQLIDGVKERVDALNNQLHESGIEIDIGQFIRVSTGSILKSEDTEEEFATQMRTYGILLEDLNSRADHTIETYVQLRSELRKAYKAFSETGDIETYRQTLLGLGIDAEIVEGMLAELVLGTNSISTNTASAAAAMDAVETSMDNAAKQGKNLEDSMSGIATETGSADDALKNERRTLIDIKSKIGNAETANDNLATSTDALATTTENGIITMDTALKNNLSGWNDYAAQLANIMTGITNAQMAFWANLSDGAVSAVTEMNAQIATMATNAENAFTHAWQNVIASMSNSSTPFQNIASGINTYMRASLNNLITGLNNVLRNSLGQMNTVLQQLRSTNVMGAYPFGAIKNIRIPQIPKLAQGAVIPANHEFLAILGDQQHGTNIEAPLDTIVQAMLTALNATGVGRGATAEEIAAAMTNIVVQFDGRQVGRVVAAQIDENRREDGKFAYNLA